MNQETGSKMARIKSSPEVGDQIIQECGIRLRVTAVDGDNVSWERITRTGKIIEPNTWSLAGWRDVVCKNAKAA